MKEKQHYYYPAAPSPPPSPPPCLAPFPSLLPSSPAFCWPPPWAPQLAQSSSHLSPAGPLLPWKPTGPPVPTGSLESPAALTLSASLPCPGPASPLSAWPPSLLFTLPLPWTSLWPWAGLQPPGQTAQLPLLPSHPVTSSPHLPTLGPACKPAQGPDIPTRGHLDLWELCESGTCWAQGAACAWPLRGSPVGPPVLQEALISPSEFSATWGSGPGQPVGAPPRDRAIGPRNMTNCSVSTLGPIHALRVPTGRGWLGSVDSGYLPLQGCSFPGAKRCPHCSEGATVPCAWYLPHPRSQPPQETVTRAPFGRAKVGEAVAGGGGVEPC